MVGMSSAARAVLLLISIFAVGSVPGSDAVSTGSRRQLHQAVAIASSDSTAGPGTNAVSSNSANAVSTGKPTIAVSQGVTDTTGGGQSLTTRCSAYAYNSATYKLCVNGQVVGSTSTPYQPTNGLTFINAPACMAQLGGGAFHVSDSSCRYWGYENSASCAYKDGAGNPLMLAGGNC